MSGHHPTVLWSRRCSWSYCECGWKSPLFRQHRAASVAWAEHIADRARRRAKRRHLTEVVS